MEEEYNHGRTEQDMKENGIKIKRMGRVNLYILMAMYMMVNGLMTKLLERVFIIIIMVQNMMVNG